jgi:hypothetical protein
MPKSIDRELLKDASERLAKWAADTWFLPPEAEHRIQIEGAGLLNEIASILKLRKP